jgi:hypothetical protein
MTSKKPTKKKGVINENVVFTTGIKIKSYFNILIGPGILLPID